MDWTRSYHDMARTVPIEPRAKEHNSKQCAPFLQSPRPHRRFCRVTSALGLCLADGKSAEAMTIYRHPAQRPERLWLVETATCVRERLPARNSARCSTGSRVKL